MNMIGKEYARQRINHRVGQIKDLERLVKNNRDIIQYMKHAGELITYYYCVEDMIKIYNLAYEEQISLADFKIENALDAIR